MKRTIGVVVGFLTSLILNAQNTPFADNYQIIYEGGFKVKCFCELRINTSFINLMKVENPEVKVFAYICVDNESNYNTGTIVNINVYDESEYYKNFTSEDSSYYEKQYLEQYASSLREAGIVSNTTTFNNADAIEYSFYQEDIPTSSIIFMINKKSYLIQVASRTDLLSKYLYVKNSFLLL